jgi:phenylpropionate dioxygenase-like ring-hydroxylating dioxygenase large terminal subunit
MSIGQANNAPIVWPKKIHHVPKEIFVREDVFQEELRRFFYGPEWIPVCHASEIPNKGDFKTCSVGKVPLLITRDQDGELHVFFNACSHRGTQVETGSSGNRADFECPYHRWLFNGKGSLIGFPSKPEQYSPGFAKENYSLQSPRVETFHGLVFVTFSAETPPLASFLAGLEERLLDVLGGDGRLKLLGYQKFVIKANWKTYMDNDGYHAPLLHRAFRMLNWQGGKARRFVNARGDKCMASELSLPKGASLLKDPSLIDYKGGDFSRGSVLVRLFPMFSAVKHLDAINLRFNNPSSVSETEMTYAYFGHEDDDEAMTRHRIRQASNLLGPCGMVSMEDASVFHRLHIGASTPGTAVFQKGVIDDYVLPEEFGQNDETPNIPTWLYYRDRMGFAKETE